MILITLVFGAIVVYPFKQNRDHAVGRCFKSAPQRLCPGVCEVWSHTRAAYRQFDQIIADLHYQLPSRNLGQKNRSEHSWRSDNDLGGVSLNADIKIGSGTLPPLLPALLEVEPSNDRDFTNLSVLTLSQAPSNTSNGRRRSAIGTFHRDSTG